MESNFRTGSFDGETVTPTSSPLVFSTKQELDLLLAVAAVVAAAARRAAKLARLSCETVDVFERVTPSFRRA